MHDDAVASYGDDLVSSAPAGRTLRLFLADGTPQGLVVAEIMNWTGKVLVAPRARLGELLKRSEASRTGIYILTGPDPDRPGGTLVYVGEGDNVAARLRIHLRSEDKDCARAVPPTITCLRVVLAAMVCPPPILVGTHTGSDLPDKSMLNVRGRAASPPRSPSWRGCCVMVLTG